MLLMFSGMLTMVLTWALFAVMFWGVGLSVLVLLHLPRISREAVGLSFWIGIATVLGILQIWHLFLPVTELTFWCFVSAGVMAFLFHARSLWFIVRKIPSSCWFYLAGVAVASLWVSNRAMGPMTEYDAGLYHINAIRWIKEYPLIPGLANLHGRLGFNTSHFLLVALMDACPWIPSAHYICAGFLLCSLLLFVGAAAFRVLTGHKPVHLHDVFASCLAIPAVIQCVMDATTTSPDIAVLTIGSVVAIMLCRALFSDTMDDKVFLDVSAITILAAAGITCKLSYVVMGGTCILAAWAWLLWVRLPQEGVRRLVVTGSRLLLPVILLLLPWLWRGVVGSGYLLYPSVTFGFPVDWAVPPELARDVAAWIMSWARKPFVRPSIVLASWEWLPGWGQRMWADYKVTVIAPTLVGIVSLCVCLLRGALSRRRILFLLPPVAALTMWFLAAPEPRFAGAAFWCFGAGGVVLCLTQKGRSVNAVVARLVVLLVAAGLLILYRNDNKFLEPGIQQGYHPPPPTPVMVERTTRSGLTVYVPKQGNQCWDAPLPCVRVFRPGLRLRNPDDIRKGFRQDYDGTYPRFPGDSWKAAPLQEGDEE